MRRDVSNARTDVRRGRPEKPKESQKESQVLKSRVDPFPPVPGGFRRYRDPPLFRRRKKSGRRFTRRRKKINVYVFFGVTIIVMDTETGVLCRVYKSIVQCPQCL